MKNTYKKAIYAIPAAITVNVQSTDIISVSEPLAALIDGGIGAGDVVSWN